MDNHEPWILLVAVPVFVLFGFRSFRFFNRAKKKPDGR